MPDFPADLRLILAHKQKTSARLRFLRFPHGMTAFSSGLDNRFPLAGGLNEAFSDIMAVSIDFFYRPATANYRIGEDVVPIFAGSGEDMEQEECGPLTAVAIEELHSVDVGGE